MYPMQMLFGVNTGMYVVRSRTGTVRLLYDVTTQNENNNYTCNNSHPNILKEHRFILSFYKKTNTIKCHIMILPNVFICSFL